MNHKLKECIMGQYVIGTIIGILVISSIRAFDNDELLGLIFITIAVFMMILSLMENLKEIKKQWNG